MSEEKGPARPRQVTMAAVMAVVGSLVLVIGLFDTLGRLRTPDMRDAVDEFLAEAPGSSLGTDTAQVIELMRGLAFVSGALAAMCLVFAIYAMQRHRGARIGLTIGAALLVLTVPVAGLMPFFLAAAALILWLQPARDWFLGRAPAPAAPAPTLPLLTQPDPGHERPQEWPVNQPQQPSQPQQGQPQGQGWTQPAYGPPPYPQAFGQPSPPAGYPPQPAYPPQQPAYDPYASQGYPGPGYPYPQTSSPDKRPTSVSIAAMLTWLGAGATALLMLAFVGILALGGDAFVEEFDKAARQSDVTITSDQALAAGWVIAVTFLAWSISALVLGILAFRRSNGARIALVVSAVMSALLSLVAVTSVISLVTLVMSVATVILLFTGGANQWYARRSGGGYPPTGPSGYPSYYMQPPGAQPQQQAPPQQPPSPTPPGQGNKPW